MTQTAEFKRWFAGSKVVDGQGKPLVLYRGTFDDFAEFSKTGDIGFHFASAAIANNRLTKAASERKLRGHARTNGTNIMPVYLHQESAASGRRSP